MQGGHKKPKARFGGISYDLRRGNEASPISRVLGAHTRSLRSALFERTALDRRNRVAPGGDGHETEQSNRSLE